MSAFGPWEGDGFPWLPLPCELAASLVKCHEAHAHPECGGEFVTLALTGDDDFPYWALRYPGEADNPKTAFGREYVPGDGLPFDADAAAARLLSDARTGLRELTGRWKKE